ncbi:MAG TPA: YdbL family protein [Steroidobacteraceae bacterium]|nr:YdbL family protein [Steroidobacteraceae bacterium]
MRRLATFKVLALLSVLVAACVTINVYFPAAAAEKAADRIIDDVWGPQGQPAAPKPGDKTSLLAPDGMQHLLFAAAGAVLDFVIPAAQAQVDLDVSTPEIRAITASMESRHAQLAKYYGSGAVGLTEDGLVEVRDQNAIPLPERNTVRQLVADENRDRGALYAQIAKANGHPEWEADIRKTFATRWIAKAQGGWYYKQGGSWKQK